MKCEVGAADLKRILASTSAVKAPVARFAVADGALRLTVDDGAVRVETSAPAEATIDGTIYVPVAVFRSLTKVLPASSAVTITADHGLVDVAADTGDDPVRWTIRCVPPGSPDVARIPNTPDLPPFLTDVDLAAFTKLVARILLAVGSDIHRPSTTVVSIRQQGNYLHLAGTDTYRLHFARTRMIDHTLWRQESLIPATAIGLIAGVIGADGTARLHLDTTQFHVETDTASITARLVQTEYPSYRKFLLSEQSSTTIASCSTAALRLALERVKPFAQLGGGAVTVTAVPEDNLLVVEASAAEYGESAATIHASAVTGSGVSFSAAADHFADALVAIEADHVELHWSEADPVVIVGQNSPAFQAIIQSVHIQRGKRR